jgi:uncharacterized protein
MMMKKFLIHWFLWAILSSLSIARDFSLKEIEGAPDPVLTAARNVTQSDEQAKVAESLVELRRAVVEGDRYAALVVGYCEETGKGTPRSIPAALASYKTAAEAGLPAGMLRYGMALRAGNGVTNPNYPAAREWLGKAEKAGAAGAMLELARMDYAGEGIARPDVDKARFLVTTAAEAGSPEAMVELGRGLKAGAFGAAPDYQAARQWFERAAKEGKDAEATLELGLLYEEGKGVPSDIDRALFYYRSAAQQDLALAWFRLGLCSLNGLGGEPDLQAAVEWFQKAAAKDLSMAMFQLATICDQGSKGVPVDNAKATEWYHKAAELGDLPSQNQLGLRYRDGRGTTKAPDKALQWFSSAASRRFPPAMVNLGTLYEDGYDKVVTQDYATAARLYSEAVRQGDAVGQFRLAHLYESGKGVEKDLVAAFVLTAESARFGHKPAAAFNAKLKPQLTPEQLKIAEQRLGRKIP